MTLRSLRSYFLTQKDEILRFFTIKCKKEEAYVRRSLVGKVFPGQNAMNVESLFSVFYSESNSPLELLGNIC